MIELGNWGHLCIDMQRLFAEDTPWHVEWMNGVLPQVEEVSGRFPKRTIFTRFVPPVHARDMRGTWQDYYAKWWMLTREHLSSELVELVPRLQSWRPRRRSLTSAPIRRGSKVVCMPPSFMKRWKLSLSRAARPMSASLPPCLGQSIWGIVLSCYPTECAVGRTVHTTLR